MRALGLYAVSAVVLFCARGAAETNAASLVGIASDAVLLEDDECVVDDQSPACAMHALQLRGQAVGVQRLASAEEQASRPLPKTDDDSDDDTPLVKHHALAGDDLVVSSFAELRYAVENSPIGNTIEVTQGSTIVFDGTINIGENQTFTIWSHGATLDGKNAYGQLRMFYVRGNLNLHGFLLKNGKTDYAGAIYFDSNSVGNLTKCNFVGNQATYVGGAMVVKAATLSLTDVNFKDNRADNTCLSELHCPHKKPGERRGNAVYVISHARIQATLPQQSATQDFFFDNDFDGDAQFCGVRPSLTAAAPKLAKPRVHTLAVTKDGCDFIQDATDELLDDPALEMSRAKHH